MGIVRSGEEAAVDYLLEVLGADADLVFPPKENVVR